MANSHWHEGSIACIPGRGLTAVDPMIPEQRLEWRGELDLMSGSRWENYIETFQHGRVENAPSNTTSMTGTDQVKCMNHPFDSSLKGWQALYTRRSRPDGPNGSDGFSTKPFLCSFVLHIDLQLCQSSPATRLRGCEMPTGR